MSVSELEVSSPPENFAPGGLASSIVLPGNIVVYGFTVYSSKASAQYVNVFDAQTLPADTAVPLFSWPVSAHNGIGFSWPVNGRRFKSGLVICNSSTDATKTIGSADCFFDVQWVPLYGLEAGPL